MEKKPGVSRVVKIDMDNLDHELEEHPRNMYLTGVALADAKLEQDQAKAELELAKAEALLSIHNDPSKYNLQKTTEAIVAAMVLTLPRVRKATDRYINSGHVVEVLKAKHLALIHKKDSLSSLTYLQNQGYHATPQPLPPLKKRKSNA